MRKVLLLLLAISSGCFAQNYARMISGVSYQSGVPPYFFSPVSATQLVTFTGSAASTATLPSGMTAGMGAGRVFSMNNIGAGTVTIACSGCTINGVASIQLSTNQSADLYSDGFNYSGPVSGAGLGAGPFYFNYSGVQGTPNFDAAVEAVPNTTYTAGVSANKRTIGFMAVATDNSNVNTTATIGYDEFGPTIIGTNTASVIAYDAEMNFGGYPATVGAVVGLELNMPGASKYNGPTTGILMDILNGTGGNTGILFSNTPNQLAAAADYAINEVSPYMKNNFGRVQFADAMTCTMSSGTCSAQTIPSTVAPGQAFNATPKCIGLTWTGTGTLTGILKCVCTTTTCTPSSTVGSDTAQVNFIAIGN